MAVRIGITLGDPSGIGPELVAKLLALPQTREASVLLVGDEWTMREGQGSAGSTYPYRVVQDLEGVDLAPGEPVLLDCGLASPAEIRLGEATEAGGRACLEGLSRALELARGGVVDSIVFAPLNKQAMHMAGLGFDDELQWMAHELDHHGAHGEINVLDHLWTTRVTSHVPLRDVAVLITEDRILEATRLADGALRAAGIDSPRIGVAALNPHAGDGGVFGREEIDVIAPAVEKAVGEGMQAEGPFPADTVFVRARNGDFDAVVTMYHDQGQIAMKLMGFGDGVTVAGGLPVPVTTPAHGTAYDIAGKGLANVGATRKAFAIACAMGERRRMS